MERPEYFVNEKVRGEVFRHFGYFMTESTGHLSEYLPYFRKNDRALSLYCDEPAFGGETGAYLKWCASVAHKYESVDVLQGESAKLPPRSVEYGSYIIEAIEKNRTFRFNGNLRNNGLIPNLPADCCAEVPVFADGVGLHPTYVGPLPSQCAALNLTNIQVQRLAVEAAQSGDPEAIVHACALDPLTSAKLTLAEIRDMAADMLEAERAWLPQFQGRAIRRLPVISIPKDVQRAPAPIDPALAIFARFGELGAKAQIEQE
jgi:alpha-galactosidase